MNDTALIDEARVNLGIAKANLNLGKFVKSGLIYY